MTLPLLILVPIAWVVLFSALAILSEGDDFSRTDALVLMIMAFCIWSTYLAGYFSK